MQSGDLKGPVPVPPPFIYALALGVGGLLDRIRPAPMLDMPWSSIVGNGLIVLSLLVLLPVFRQFYLLRTSFNVRRAASALITRGPYRYSRNPAYICLSIIYVSLAVLWDSAWVLALLLPVLLIMNVWVVPSEERHLEARFGEAYRKYCLQVPRWL